MGDGRMHWLSGGGGAGHSKVLRIYLGVLQELGRLG